ncbi:MAG: response regulator transcription factor [Chloroflexota bacterium]|nr:response regulator transcription factor [Chloroflexota bacterium]
MEKQTRILVVDDEPSVCVALEAVLVREGYEVLTAHSGAEALQIMEQEPVALALLDLNMPGMDGLQLMGEIRNHWPDTVMMILTGYGTLESALGSLRHGAHDYLLKPSSPADIKTSVRKGLEKRWEQLRRKQLLTRIEADVRALTENDSDVGPVPPLAAEEAKPEPVLKIGELVIDLYKHSVILKGRLVNLTPTEFDTLVALARKPGRVLSCAELVKEVQGYECEEREARGVIKTHISHLRQKLEPDPVNPCYVINVRGVGYMLVSSDEDTSAEGE